MNALLSHIASRIRRFSRDDSGTITAETLVMLVPLCWCYIGTFVFYDALRTANINEKAAYTVADLLSRQTEMVTKSDINGMKDIFDYLIQHQGPSAMRVTSITYDEDDDEYSAIWSVATDARPVHTDSSIEGERGRLPAMPDGETVILVETFTKFTPLSSRMGIEARELQTFIVTRPRFAAQVVYAGS